MTKQLELTHQRDEMNKLLKEVDNEHKKDGGTLQEKVEYERKRNRIILEYRNVATHILLKFK